MGNIYEVVLFWGHPKGQTWHIVARGFDEAVEKTKASIKKWQVATRNDFQPIIAIESVILLYTLDA